MMNSQFLTLRTRRKTGRYLLYAIAAAFLCAVMFLSQIVPVAAQDAQPAEQPPAPEENLPDLNSLTNHLFLPAFNGGGAEEVPAEVKSSDSVDDLPALGANIVACNAKNGWKYAHNRRWSSSVSNTVVSNCPNIYVNPSISGSVQVYYYSRTQGRWIYKQPRWAKRGQWKEMGTSFRAGTRWYARIYHYQSSRWVNVKTTSGRVASSTRPSNSGATLTHSQAVDMLRAAGIKEIVSSGNCSNKNNPTCTSLDGIRRGSIQGLIDFKKKCDRVKGDCTITVTGGTETGHSKGTYSHGTGYKIDIRWTFNGRSDNYAGQYIKENFTRVYNRGSWGAAYVDPATKYLYVFESGSSAHWDICFDSRCGY